MVETNDPAGWYPDPQVSGRQRYWVMDAAVGIVERGSWAVADAIKEQPWLPEGPIDTQVDYRMSGYERVSHSTRAPEAKVIA